MNLVQLGPLAAVLTPAIAPKEVRRTIILLHGYGAPGTDLVGLAQSIRVRAGTQFVFLQAPHTLDGLGGPHAPRAWWNIDMMALQAARLGKKFDELAAQEPQGLDEVRDTLSGALSELERNHGLVYEETILGGFSQGAMLSCDWALRSSKKLAGLIQFSGTVICEEAWKTAMKERRALPVFQSHSPDDQVLPFALAERLQAQMIEAGMEHTFVPFRGGHGIAPPVLHGVSEFINALGF